MEPGRAVNKILTGMLLDGLILPEHVGDTRMRLQWVYAAGFDHGRGNKTYSGKPIHKYSLVGEFICTFPSLREAARDAGAHASTLSDAARRGWKCKGFYWAYAEPKNNKQ